MAKAIRIRYENGVLRPLELVDLVNGKEIVVFIHKKMVRKVPDEYVGIFGEASVEELR
ncbi:MAG: antitoxin family protein [Ignisphaera sp.]